ncbi:hypothetical protein IAT40_000357 [Kwoniella sp. CBS 6097]
MYNRNIRLRYVLFTISFILWVAPFSIVNAIEGSDLSMGVRGVLSGAAIAMIAYVPAAIAHSAKNSPVKLARAGLEIAYLVFIALLHLAAGIMAAIDTGADLCVGPEGYDLRLCHNVDIAIAVLCFIHAIFMAVWAVWIIHVVREAKVEGVSGVYGGFYGVPVHKLLRRDYGSGFRSREHSIEVGGEQDAQGLFNRRS